jgi:hypothetical protein
MLKDVARCEFNDNFAIFSECDYSNESCPNTPSILTRPQSSHVLNPHTPSIFARPHSLRAPRLYRDWTLVSTKPSPTALNIRHLQLSHAGLRIGMEDDVLHFTEGVLVDDVMVTLPITIQPDSKPSQRHSPRHATSEDPPSCPAPLQQRGERPAACLLCPAEPCMHLHPFLHPPSLGTSSLFLNPH